MLLFQSQDTPGLPIKMILIEFLIALLNKLIMYPLKTISFSHSPTLSGIRLQCVREPVFTTKTVRTVQYVAPPRNSSTTVAFVTVDSTVSEHAVDSKTITRRAVSLLKV